MSRKYTSLLLLHGLDCHGLDMNLRPLAGDPSEEVRVMACTDGLLTASSGVAGRLLVSRALEGRSGGRNTEPADVSCSCRVFLCSASFSLKESLSGSNRTGFSATFGGATDREKRERGEGWRERETLLHHTYIPLHFPGSGTNHGFTFSCLPCMLIQ